jgi:hypothetical protein
MNAEREREREFEGHEKDKGHRPGNGSEGIDRKAVDEKSKSSGTEQRLLQRIREEWGWDGERRSLNEREKEVMNR